VLVVSSGPGESLLDPSLHARPSTANKTHRVADVVRDLIARRAILMGRAMLDGALSQH